MDVILTKDVEKIGLRGDVVSVARGYARNFLLPRQLAEVATPARVAELQKRETNRARHEAKTAEQAQSIAETLTKTVLRFDVKAGPTGSLFGSVTPTDIADEIRGYHGVGRAIEVGEEIAESERQQRDAHQKRPRCCNWRGGPAAGLDGCLHLANSPCPAVLLLPPVWR